MAKARPPYKPCFSYLLVFLCLILLHFHFGKCELQLHYYSKSCPRAEEIVKTKLVTIREKIGTVSESFLRYLFHDCMVKGCDASLLLRSVKGVISEQQANNNFGLRNFRYLEEIKEAVERECPSTVSCADVLALAARDSIALMGGPQIPMKTGRRDSKESYFNMVDQFINLGNDSTGSVLSHFGAIGLNAEEVVAILGSHSVGRTHCKNIVERLYPAVDPTMNPTYAKYLKTRCPTAFPDHKNQMYARNDHETPYILDNQYFKNLLAHKGILKVDQQLTYNPRTAPFVQMFANDNHYFFKVFSKAILKLSEYNPLTGDQGEIRKNCQFVNSNNTHKHK